MKSDTLLEKYRSELTEKSISFYSNDDITNYDKVQKHKKFLENLLYRLEKDKYDISNSTGYNELYNIIKKAAEGIKVQKTNFFRNIAINLYGKVKA